MILKENSRKVCTGKKFLPFSQPNNIFIARKVHTGHEYFSFQIPMILLSIKLIILAHAKKYLIISQLLICIHI